MHAFVLGASKNIGYHAALRLLKQGTTVTFLLRSTSIFDNDEEIQPFFKDGKAQLVRGDAFNRDDVRKGWEAAVQASAGKVGVVLSTIGSYSEFSAPARWLELKHRPWFLPRPSRSLHALPGSLRAPETQPRFVVITAMAVTSESQAAVPLVLKPLYYVVLPAALADKLGVERILSHAAGWSWSSKDDPSNDILTQGWKSTPGLPRQGDLKHVVIVRPAVLTDGESRGDEAVKSGNEPYRTKKVVIMSSAYRVLRKDVAHFVVEKVLPNWSEWEGYGVVIAY
ncbi:hypothetical protein K466DRAFT_479083 [Polyporus arcularius HHB13444]|uniref:NAD(P)-binding domain-containing protein n=1 Tax=Polyporus arcularius HHB13444 TaxID=1314778 RepID=A0A5C3PZD1_9APHY|nr:hypothetical protein K466DRAFT_479083 [Polyporus arcularius HHB13444]